MNDSERKRVLLRLFAALLGLAAGAGAVVVAVLLVTSVIT